jgi:hypothetical protein
MLRGAAGSMQPTYETNSPLGFLFPHSSLLALPCAYFL